MISMDAAKTLFKQFGDHIRCGYVLYPSMGATTHSTQHLYTPSLRFVHHPADGRDRQYYMTGDGPNVLGDRRAQANWFGQEGAFGFKNWFAQANVDLGISVNTLLESATYRDEKGVLRALRGTEMDVDDDEQYKMITLYRRFYFWWLDVLSTYSLGITKADFKAHQKALKARIEGGAPRPKVLPTEHNILPRLRHHIPSVESLHVIRRIISRRQQGAEALWTVVLEGSEEDIDVVEKNTPWLSVGENGVKCLQYILKYGTGPPPQTTPASAGIEIPSTESNFVSHAPPAVNPGSSNVVTANSSSTEPLIRPLLPQTDPAVHASTSTQGGSSAQAGALLKRKRGHQQEPTVDSDGAQVISDTEPEGNSKRRRKKNLNTVVSDSESEQPPPQKPKRKRKTPVFSESEMSETEEQPQGKGKEPLFLPSDHEDSDVDEFEVEEIIAWRDQEGETEWLVRWKGFGPEDDTWLGLDRLDGAHELLHAFNHDHGLSLPSGSTPSSTHSTPSPAPSSDEEFPEPKPGNPRGRRVSRLIGGDIEEAWKPDKKALNTKFLGHLFDPVTLLQERTDLEVAAKVLEQKQNIWLAGTESSRDIASRIVDQIEVHNDLSTQMYFELPSVAAGTWGSRLARLTLECVANIGTNVPNLVSVGQIQDLVSRGIRSQVCRALVATYQWLVHLGPSLAAHLIAIHEDKGVDSLREEFPALAPMVEHVLGFVGEERAWRQRKVSSKGKKTRGRKPARQVGRPRTVDLSPAEGTEEPQAPAKKPSTYARAPKDLWGLLPSAKSSTIALAVPPANTKMVTDEQVRQVAITTLCQLWDDNLILDPMRAVDEYFGKQRIKKSASARVNVRERCITRGAILQSLADVFGDGIFACSAMQSFLIQPSRLFASNLARDTLFARSIERDEYGTLKALDDHLAGVLAEAPEVRDACMELAELVHRGLLSLKLGRSMSDEEYSIHLFYLGAFPVHAVTIRHKAQASATLLPKIPEFGVAAIIVRKALSERRDKPATPGTTVFRRLLTAHHPSTGAPTRQDRDQMDPIRADLQSFRWLRKLIPFDELRTGSGLSSLLVYMGTGQGSGTLEFLENRDVVPGKMHFKSLNEAVEVFTVTENRAVSFPNMEIKYENPCVYEQVNSWYSLHPKYSVRGQTVELTIREKLGAYFEEELQTRWVALVGPDSPKPEWEDVLRWILHSELRGTGQSPSPATMAQWIYLNKGFGAFAGLKALGFQLPDNASPAAVRAAFFCFYKWFETYLTEEDKETVHFGTIFAEQLLCKVGQWKKRMMKSMGKKDLSVMARPLFEGKPWTPGENWDDHTKWPIPSAQDFPLSVFKSIVEDGGTELDIEEDNEDDTMDVDT
ncbi:hypothetical protein C8F04DRAFT_1296445 [Mycena alexandri]|uniref:Chromo domain-containing protein n=1 Tax=Mycena alexandri TaxID=1745969 RepID=A0AAD6WVW1_9AGAR|nr:hypothetical protein C8F04DRAFT_1296445 [Mycena alexandri]